MAKLGGENYRTAAINMDQWCIRKFKKIYIVIKDVKYFCCLGMDIISDYTFNDCDVTLRPDSRYRDSHFPVKSESNIYIYYSIVACGVTSANNNQTNRELLFYQFTVPYPVQHEPNFMDLGASLLF